MVHTWPVFQSCPDQFHGSQPSYYPHKNPVDSFQVGIGCIHLPHWPWSSTKPAAWTTVPAWLKKMAITSVKATVIYTLPRRFSVQFDFILFTIDGFTFTPSFRTGGLVSKAWSSSSNTGWNCITPTRPYKSLIKALPVFQITQSLLDCFRPLGLHQKG